MNWHYILYLHKFESCHSKITQTSDSEDYIYKIYLFILTHLHRIFSVQDLTSIFNGYQANWLFIPIPSSFKSVFIELKQGFTLDLNVLHKGVKFYRKCSSDDYCSMQFYVFVIHSIHKSRIVHLVNNQGL